MLYEDEIESQPEPFIPRACFANGLFSRIGESKAQPCRENGEGNDQANALRACMLGACEPPSRYTTRSQQPRSTVYGNVSLCNACSVPRIPVLWLIHTLALASKSATCKRVGWLRLGWAVKE
ncbi:unnamed protein product [Xylocopa violacea]|uniref:Uncharacterized protein n=1 Tax=Xylocopa violacea TaxID=135666 RepID=A0ABP1P578_XYLVO